MQVLIVKLTSLGDVIHTLPAVTDAARQVQNLQVHWLVEESFKAIPAWHPAVSQIITAATRRWRKQPLKFFTEKLNLKRQLQRQHYDLVIDAQGLLKSALLSRYANAQKVGYDKHSSKEPLASYLYDQPIRISKKDHAINRTRSLFANALNYQLDHQIDYGLTTDQFAQNPNSNHLVFLHGTTRTNKEWPVKHWQRLVELAALHDYEVKLLWGNAREYQRACEIAKSRNNAVICKQMNLDEIATLLSDARGIVAVDTGLGHLAAALSVPCVSIYLTTNSELIGTIGQSQKHLQASFESLSASTQFSPETVWQELEQLMDKE